jgi:hypothetical protein
MRLHAVCLTDRPKINLDKSIPYAADSTVCFKFSYQVNGEQFLFK